MDEIFSKLPVPPFFERFSQDDRRRLIGLADRHKAPQGEVLLTQGEPTRGAWLILSGSVSLTRRNRQGQSFVLARLSDLEIFGELELIDRGDSMVSVRAETPCDLLHMSTEAFRALIDDRDPLAFELMYGLSAVASQRLRDLDLQLVERLQEPGTFGDRAAPSVPTIADPSASPGDLFRDLLSGLFTSRARRQKP